jgi:hypothetical protein
MVRGLGTVLHFEHGTTIMNFASPTEAYLHWVVANHVNLDPTAIRRLNFLR